MHTHAERGHDQSQPSLTKSKNASALTAPFPAKAGPTKKHRVHLRDRRRPRRTGFSREAFDLL